MGTGKGDLTIQGLNMGNKPAQHTPHSTTTPSKPKQDTKLCPGAVKLKNILCAMATDIQFSMR